MMPNFPDGDQIRQRAVDLQRELADAMRGCVPSEGDWYQDLICELGVQARASVTQMLQADDEQDLNRTSWAARNLLELYIWVPYVLTSRENARRFYEDAICDFEDIFKTLGKFPGVEPIEELGKKAIEELAEHRQVTKNGDKFLPISQIAKDRGEEFQYGITNKFLSKLVHTTSMSIRLRFNKNGMRELLATATVQSGAQSMEKIFPLLIEELKRLHPPA